MAFFVIHYCPHGFMLCLGVGVGAGYRPGWFRRAVSGGQATAGWIQLATALCHKGKIPGIGTYRLSVIKCNVFLTSDGTGTLSCTVLEMPRSGSTGK